MYSANALIFLVLSSESVFHWNLTLHRPDRGVDQHLVKSCSCLPERGKARGAESQPSCFTSPSGTASQRPAGNRCHLLTTAGKSTKKWEVSEELIAAIWKRLLNLKQNNVPKHSPVNELSMFIWTFKSLLHGCRHCRKALVEFNICCMTAGCCLSCFTVSWHIWIWCVAAAAAAFPTLIQPVSLPGRPESQNQL